MNGFLAGHGIQGAFSRRGGKGGNRRGRISAKPSAPPAQSATGRGYEEAAGLGTPAANLLASPMAQAAAPGTPTLVSSYDTGASNQDNITYYNNSSSSQRLQFTWPTPGPLSPWTFSSSDPVI